MTQERPTPPSRPGGKNESWRVERMVQRVPAHLGETTPESVSPWIMVAGIGLLALVVCAVLFFLLGGTSRFFASATTATPTRARSITPAVTIIPVTAPPPSPSATATLVPDKYTVKPGDTLIEIAAKYKISVQAIMTANGMKDEKIRVGDVLLIPRPTPTPPPPTRTSTPVSQDSPPTAATLAASGVIYHTVQSGDTLIAIAATYGTTVDALRIANQLDSDLLRVGQTLMVPNQGWTPTATATLFAQLTPTLGSPFAYPAPNLLWPPDNFVLRGKDAPTLAWASPATLKPNEFYVLNISTGAGAQKKAWSFQIKQGTSKTLDASMYPGAEGARFAWYVVVVSQTAARAPTTTAQISASSPPSETRVFVWQ